MHKIKTYKKVLWFLLVTMFLSGKPLASLPYKKGDYATGSPHPDSAELSWLLNFNMVEIGGIGDGISSTAIEALHNAGCTILGYEWMPAGYHFTDGTPDNPFMSWVYEHRDTLTLNPNGPFPHCEGYDWCEDYYYDLALNELVTQRVDFLLTAFRDTGLDGLFFDWAAGNFIYEPEYAPIRDTFETRHPGMEYPEAVENFYRALKERDSSFLIVTNQGFREHRYILPVTDYDMTESYATTDEYFGDSLYVEGVGFTEIPKTIYYPVSVDYRTGHIEDQIFYLNYLKSVGDSSGGTNFKNFIYMNYAAPLFVPTGDTVEGHPVFRAIPPRNAIFFGYAIPKLLNYMVYTEVPWDHKLERDSIYFLNIGEPLGTTYDSLGNHVYVRYYSGGLVAAGEWEDTTLVHLESPHIPTQVMVYDAYERRWDTTGTNSINFIIKPEYDSVTGRMAPAGRVFVYDFQGIKEQKVYKISQWLKLSHTGDRVSLYALSEDVKSIKIYDASGRLMFSSPIKKKVNLPDYIGEGVYFVKIFGKQKRLLGRQKIIIVRK